jgi:hypothetical protein
MSIDDIDNFTLRLFKTMVNKESKKRSAPADDNIITPLAKVGRPSSTLKQINPAAHDLMVACISSIDTIHETFPILGADASEDAVKFAAKKKCEKVEKDVRDTMHKYIVNVRAAREEFASTEGAKIEVAKKKAKLFDTQKQFCLSYRDYDKQRLLQTQRFLLIAQSEVNFLLRTSINANPIIPKELAICNAMDEINTEQEAKAYKLPTGYSQQEEHEEIETMSDDEADDYAAVAPDDATTINEY